MLLVNVGYIYLITVDPHSKYMRRRWNPETTDSGETVDCAAGHPGDGVGEKGGTVAIEHRYVFFSKVPHL